MGSTKNCLPAGSWRKFIISTTVPFVGGLIFILIWRLIRSVYIYVMQKGKKTSGSARDMCLARIFRRVFSVQRMVKIFAEDLSYPKTRKGRIMTWLTMLFTIVAIILYLIDTSESLERCIERSAVGVILDFICNIFFLWRFTVMCIVAKDKLSFWVELNSLIDFCTIPPAFLTMYLGTTWLGLRFIRAVRLNWFGDDVAAVKLISSHKMLNLSRTLCQFVSFWLTAGGLYFLVDNMSAQNTQCTKSPCGLTFWESLYFLFITLSTIGYGDKHPSSRESQIIVIFIIIVGLAVFASFMPALVELSQKPASYLGEYDDSKSSHVIVSGYITTSTVSNFMRDFLHPENENQETTAVFLNPTPPPEELQNLMHRHFYRCQYFQGSPLGSGDLQRVKCDTAKACLVIANKHSHEPDAEDAANILRVISIKNFRACVRVIIQILNYHNEEHLFNVPDWNKVHGDEVICINELKLGLLGKSCLCPGFSTMVANLIMMSSFQPGNYNNPSNDVRDHWQYEYGFGASNELYTGAMSSDFVGMSFPMVAEICLIKLHILLIGVEVETNADSSGILFNPSPSIFRFSENSRGIFIAQNPQAVKSAAFYCYQCHEYTSNNEISKCNCDKTKFIRTGLSVPVADGQFDGQYRTVNNFELTEGYTEMPARPGPDVPNHVPFWKTLGKEERAKYDQKLTLDGTGAYHWREPCALDDVTMTKEDVATLTDHIIVCVFGDTNSPTVGLRNLLLPLRSSNLPMAEVKKVLLLGQKDYIEKEWKDLNDFQDVYFMEGSPMRREDVISAGVQNCLMCLILSSALQGKATDPNLVDKETILSFLQIKGCGGTELIAPRSFKYALNEKPKRNRMQVPIISEIVNDSNVQFMEKSKDSSQRGLHMALPFTRGQAFIVSVLDAILSLTFYNEKLMRIIRTLITGIDSHSQDPDDAFADLDDCGIAIGLNKFRPWLRTRMSCRIAQISLADERFSGIRVYGELFEMLLRRHSMLALGLYRCYKKTHKGSNKKSPTSSDRERGRNGRDNEDRYVNTAPPYDAKLRPSDKVFVLAQSEMEHNFPLEDTDKNDESDSSDNEYSYSNSPLPPTGMDVDGMSPLPPHFYAMENDHTINLEEG